MRGNFMMDVWSEWIISDTLWYSEMDLPFVFEFHDGVQSTVLQTSIGSGCGAHTDRYMNGSVCQRCRRQIHDQYEQCPSISRVPTIGIFVRDTWPQCKKNNKIINISGYFIIPDSGWHVVTKLKKCFVDTYSPSSCLRANFENGDFVEFTDNTSEQMLLHTATERRNLSYSSDQQPSYELSLKAVKTISATGGADFDGISRSRSYNIGGLMSVSVHSELVVVKETLTITPLQCLTQWFTAVHSLMAVLLFFWTSSISVPLHFKFGSERTKYKDFIYRSIHLSKET